MPNKSNRFEINQRPMMINYKNLSARNFSRCRVLRRIWRWTMVRKNNCHTTKFDELVTNTYARIRNLVKLHFKIRIHSCICLTNRRKIEFLIVTYYMVRNLVFKVRHLYSFISLLKLKFESINTVTNSLFSKHSWEWTKVIRTEIFT